MTREEAIKEHLIVVYGSLFYPKINKEFGHWLVMETNDIILFSKEIYYTNGKDLTSEGYLVDVDDIWDEDWIEHFRRKGWYTKQLEEHFKLALEYARIREQLKKVNPKQMAKDMQKMSSAPEWFKLLMRKTALENTQVEIAYGTPTD